MPTQTVSVRSHVSTIDAIDWDDASPLSMTIQTRTGTVQTRYGRFVGGVADGVEVIEVQTGDVRTMILPTRGMSIWRIDVAGAAFGWRSPVAGPVHPQHVPIFDPSGIGWLEGFDELVVRCGLESNGAPEFDDAGTLKYPLHGRIANLPASSLSIEFDEASGCVEVIGEMLESRLFVKRLRLRSRIRFQAGQPDIELLDDVTNDLTTPATMQLLYHINLGSPVLGAGATLDVPIDTLAPKDSLSASEIDSWNQFGEPKSGYAERVYFATLRADANRRSIAMLRGADGKLGFAITINTKTLPRFVLWKNTAAEPDGYVIGMEPATNFPNPRSFEQKHGRVVEIAGGETESFRVKLHPLLNAESVAEMAEKIAKLRGDEKPTIEADPKPGWSVGA
jgi:hypothetical protein